MSAIAPVALVEALATVLWCYAALCALAWIRHARRMGQGVHVPAFTELLGNLVPAMIVLVVVILFGALFGLPSVVVFIAVLFPAGLSFGLHLTLRDLCEPDPWPRRAATALVLGAAITAFRLLT